MKKLLLASASFALMAGSAFSADLPSRKDPVAVPPAAPMWTGFHVGINAGGIWSNNSSINVSTYPVSSWGSQYPVFWAPLNGSVSSGQNGGFIGGGQIGYDWQVTYAGMSFVTGVEADIQGIATNGGNKTRNSIYPGPLNGLVIPGTGTFSESIWNNTNASANLQYLGTVRGKLGYLVTPTMLIYATAGLAYGGVSINLSQTQIYNSALANVSGPVWMAIGNGNYSNTQVGYTAGGGIEWMFMPNWSTKAEYLYYNLGNVSVSSISTGIPQGIWAATNYRQSGLWNASTYNSTISGNIVRAGVNYHFNWGYAPVVAKY
jgi:outer membrane immunogenic protein